MTDEENQKRYQTIFDSDLVGILSSDMEGHITDANEYFLKMLGYSREDLERGELNWKKITAPEFVQQSIEAGAKLRAHTKLKAFEKEYIHKMGHRVPALVGLTLYENETVIALILDISERKKVQKELEDANAFLEQRVQMRTQELQQSEAFLEAVFEHNPNMIFVKEAQSLRFLRFNKAGEDLLGVPRSDLLGKNDYDFFPKEQADFFTSKDRDVLKESRVVDIPEEPIRTAHGVRYLHTKKIPIFDKMGQPKYLLGVSEDITEKKAAELQRLSLMQEQIAREEAEMRVQQMSFISEINSALTETFDQAKVLQVFCRTVVDNFCDVCSIDILSDEGIDIAHSETASVEPDDARMILEWRKKHPIRWDAKSGIGKVVRTGESEVLNRLTLDSYLHETYNKEAAEEPRKFSVGSVMILPIKVGKQRPLGVISFMRKDPNKPFTDIDISLADTLTRRLTIALENSRLYFTAQEANRAKSAFLANVSHEIRTPLGAMLGFADLIREDEELPEEHKEAIETVIRNGQQLLRIVDEILDISKVESDKIQIENIAFSLPGLLEEILHLLGARAEEKGINLFMHIRKIPEMIVSDPTRLRQILINVIGNAIKFTDKGTVELEAKVKSFDPDNGKGSLEFIISDTGIGISSEQRDNLFQPFTQADSSTTRRFGGTGLGLFLSRRLARLLGGDVILDSSASGKGSRFLVSIEFESIEAATEPLIDRPASADSSKDMQELQAKVLIVDDAPDNRELFRHYLKKLGYLPENIEMAQNGTEAVQMASKKKYFVVLMDIQMPQMDGFQALSELKKRNYRGPIVALTAHAMKGDEEKCLAAGFDAYLQKPLSREALSTTLERLAKMTSMRRPQKRFHEGSP